MVSMGASDCIDQPGGTILLQAMSRKSAQASMALKNILPGFPDSVVDMRQPLTQRQR
jgi:hypothetical protein